MDGASVDSENLRLFSVGECLPGNEKTTHGNHRSRCGDPLDELPSRDIWILGHSVPPYGDKRPYNSNGKIRKVNESLEKVSRQEFLLGI